MRSGSGSACRTARAVKTKERAWDRAWVDRLDMKVSDDTWQPVFPGNAPSKQQEAIYRFIPDLLSYPFPVSMLSYFSTAFMVDW